MPLEILETTIQNVLTRTTGYLRTVSSHSLQPYRGCTFGRSLCGVGCYVQHSRHLLAGRDWGGFLDVRTNAAESYRANVAREARWARRRTTAEPCTGGRFTIFCSSATDPFVPQEFRYRITRSLLEAMLDFPPDCLILQTHSHRVTEYLPLYLALAARCDLRVHVSIETDRERLPGLPPHASPVARRFDACETLRQAGLKTIVTVSPLLPIDDPHRFFARIARVADAVVLDHFIGGDGSSDGRRTRLTPLPQAMERICSESVELAYRDAMAQVARQYLPGRVGISNDGFAGRFTSPSDESRRPHRTDA